MRSPLQSGWLLFAGVLLCLTGIGINIFYSAKGTIVLPTGKTMQLRVGEDLDTLGNDTSNLSLTLDSMWVLPYTPEFEIISWKEQPASEPQQGMALADPETEPAASYSMEMMKIHRLGESDYYFRLKDFYPNFEFAYSYPSYRDTFSVKAPGITLELQTPDGKSMVTLGEKKPYKNRLDDIVGLGASLVYYWNTDTDSLKKALLNPMAGRTWVFLGEKQVICRVAGDSILEQPLTENKFYPTGDRDSLGFKIMFAFPDAAFLKAEPASNGTEVLNPVARVEIWKEGQSSTDAYLYPLKGGRKGGKFSVAGTGYTIGLRELKDRMLSQCECIIKVQKHTDDEHKLVKLRGDNSDMAYGFSFSLQECAPAQNTISLQTVRRKGTIWVYSGLALGLLGGFFFFSRRSNAQ